MELAGKPRKGLMHQPPTPVDISLANEQATQSLGAKLWPLLRAGDCILLSGNLGMGKTCFARGLIQAALGTNQDIPSPSFALAQYYDSNPPIWHFDFYRLKAPEEIWELGFEDALENICLIEWPEKATKYLPANALEIKFNPAPQPSQSKHSPQSAPLEAAPRIAQFIPRSDWPRRLADFL